MFYRVHALDAICTKHEHHSFETKVEVLSGQDSEQALENVSTIMKVYFGCDITDFGCYYATPI